jgi:hypothetical protein
MNTPNQLATHAAPCLLWLSLPVSQEEAVLDALLALDPQTTSDQALHLIACQALGPGIALNSSMEQVHGRARRTLIQWTLSRERVATVLSAIARAMPHPDVQWWTTEVLQSGRLG